MESKMTIRQLRNAVCNGELIVRDNNIIMQSTHDNSGKSRVELTNVMCSYDAILSLPVERINYFSTVIDSGKFVAMIDIPAAALAGMTQ